MPRPASRPKPTVWGLFSPFLPPTAPKPAVFAPPPRCFPGTTPPETAVSAPQPLGFPGSRPALRPGCRPKRARCAPFPGEPARFRPWQPGFSAVRPRLARDPARLCPKAPRAPPKSALRTRRRPELGSRWGFHPARPHRFAVVKRVPPQGGLNPWERFSGDRGPLSREIPRNSGPGGLGRKTLLMAFFADVRKKQLVQNSSQVGQSICSPAYAEICGSRKYD